MSICVFKKIMINRLVSFATVIFLLSASSSLWASRLSDIRVEGLQRVSAGTVFTALPAQVGDEYDEELLRNISHELFRTGYFADVQVGLDEHVLVLRFVERPAIGEIEIEGNKVISTEDLMKGLENNGLGEGQIFKRVTLDSLTQELRRQYVSQGRYSAEVNGTTEDLSGNRVKLTIEVKEGSVAAIKHMNIVGNTVFSDEELLDLFELRKTGMWSWMNGNDKYAREKLNGDLEKLQSYYFDRGYLKFKIDGSQVSISPDRETVYITLNVTEGNVYTVSDIELAGELVIAEEQINNLILMKPEQTFSQLLMTTTSDYITQRLGNDGFTFAEVQGVTEIDEENNTVKVTFFMEPGKRVYVRRIEFRGNTKTMDEVLRREMRQMESASASTAKIEQSRLRLDRLGFFKEVNVETVEVPGVDDQVDIIYSVEEAPSGSIGASIGYQQGSGMVLGANISQSNFMGTGNQVSFSINQSKFERSYNFSYTDPYYTKDGVSRGISLFYRERDFDQIGVANFSTDSKGFQVHYSYPLSEISRVGFGYGYTAIDLLTGRSAAQEIASSPIGTVAELSAVSGTTGYVNYSDLDIATGLYPSTLTPLALSGLSDANLQSNPDGFSDLYGHNYDLFPLTFSWTQSTLNRGRLATRGFQQRLNAELTAPGASLEYYKLSYNAQYFQPLTNKLTLRLRTELGVGDGYGDTVGLPFFENFYGGGFGSIRGFKRNTLGPGSTPAAGYAAAYNDLAVGAYVLKDGKLAVNGPTSYSHSAFGGDMLFEVGAEILFPLPFIKDQRQLQTSFFVDAGNVFSTTCPTYSEYAHVASAPSVLSSLQSRCSGFDFSRLRISTGFGLTWITGMGPMTFSIARPLQEEEGDQKEFFQFSLGTTF